jgi:hypothetical protein
VKSPFAVVSVFGVVLVAAACGSDSPVAPKPPIGPDAASCVVGTLSVGTTVSGDLNPTTAKCSDSLFWDSSTSTIYESYNFGVQSGKGYLISLLATWDNHVELMGGTSAAEQMLGVADYSAPRQSTIPFVAKSTTAYSVRVGADDPDHNLADTGAFTLRVQSCKVPLTTITDSVSHSDNLAPTDCTVPEGDFTTGDSSYVHLYTIHFDSAGTRTFYFAVPGAPLAFDMGGPLYDPYGYLGNSIGVQNVANGSSVTFTAGDSGTYTMILGTSTYSATSQSYTMTVGADIPAALHVTPPPSRSSSVNFTNRAALKANKHGR